MLQQPLPQGHHDKISLAFLFKLDITYSECLCRSAILTYLISLLLFAFSNLFLLLFLISFLYHLLPRQLLPPSCVSLLLLFSVCPYIIPPHPGLYCSNSVLQRSSLGQETAAVPPLCHLQPDPRPMGLYPVPEGSL